MLVRELFYGEVLSRNLHASPSELRRLQLEKLRRTLKLAYENVPFYNRKFRSANVKPEDISTFDDLKKIPFTTKSEIETCPVQDVISAKADAAKILWRSTSGSTGTPLNIGYDPRTVELEGALWHRRER